MRLFNIVENASVADTLAHATKPEMIALDTESRKVSPSHDVAIDSHVTVSASSV